MANNRLYIVDKATGERFCLAKSISRGWYTEEGMQERFDEWLNAINEDSGTSRGFLSSVSFQDACEFGIEDEGDEARRAGYKSEARLLEEKMAKAGEN